MLASQKRRSFHQAFFRCRITLLTVCTFTVVLLIIEKGATNFLGERTRVSGFTVHARRAASEIIGRFRCGAAAGAHFSLGYQDPAGPTFHVKVPAPASRGNPKNRSNGRKKEPMISREAERRPENREFRAEKRKRPFPCRGRRKLRVAGQTRRC